MRLNSICVFCGSSCGARPEYVRTAQNLGTLLADCQITLVYGGGNVGLMGKIADAVMEAGGRVIGVIPESLASKELAHQSITQLHVVKSMHQRKEMMAELADGFIALPGGYGTLEELCEIITWCQLGFHAKPCGVLNLDNFFGGLLAQFDHGVREKFIRPEHRSLVLTSDDPRMLLDQLTQFSPPVLEKWIDELRS